MNRQSVTDYIFKEFGVSGEYLWMRFPDYAVFRNARNKKWFAVIMDIEKNKLGIKGTGKADIVVMKCDPILIGSLLHDKGFLPAYHMNKANWITALLDGSINDGELKNLLRLSYDIIDRKN